MDINQLQERIVKANDKLQKLLKKKERIEIALSGGKNPYYYSEPDLRSCLSDISKCMENIEKLTGKLMIEQQRLVVNIPVVDEFLNNWANKAYEFYINEVGMLRAYMIQIKHKKDKYVDEIKQQGINPYGIKADEMLSKVGLSYSDIENYKKLHYSKVSIALERERNLEEKLYSIIQKEKIIKRNLFIERVTEITGDITDASQLYIADNGEINGVVTGTKGSARVNTIYAGGYNIQCLHFRVLVNKID